MRITAKIDETEVAQDITITIEGLDGKSWTDDEISSLGIDAAARAWGGCLADEVNESLALAGWQIVPGSWQSVGFIHHCQARPVAIPHELAERVRRPLHCITAAESKRLGAPWCSPIGESRPGWWYLDADGVPQHAGPAEIGEDGARAAAEQGLSTRAFTL